MSVVAPLKSLDELIRYKRPPLCVVEPLRDIERGEPGRPKILYCHDTDIYLEDKYVYGSNKMDSYRFYHWQIIDTFVYYSHHMVTIPPPCWITAAHKHGVKVLGTFTLEPDEGIKAVNKIKGGNQIAAVASQLALIAARSRFDGWLVRIATRMDGSAGRFVNELLTAIAQETHRSVPGSTVIWQDSILPNGTVEPQSELNDRNWGFFNMCDGILLNYQWNESLLQNSANRAGKRKGDVYVGVDVFARDTCYNGGYDMHKAVAIVRGYGLSAAILGAGWVVEKQEKKKFTENQCLLWALPDDCSSEWRAKTLPLSTTFCQGFGTSQYKQGQAVMSAPWFNLSRQELQPRDQGMMLCGGGGSAMVHTAEAYKGGGCLRLAYDPKQAPGSTVIPYFRLFGCDLPLGSLCVSYTYKTPSCLAGHDINLILKVRDATGKREELSIGSIITVPQGGNYIVKRDISNNPQGDPGSSATLWLTRKYHVKDATGSAVLEETGMAFGSHEQNAFLVGELVLKRPDGAASSKAAKDSDAEASSDEDSAGRPETEEKLQEWLAKSTAMNTGQADGPVTFDISMSSDESD
ncbi:hypothetical protein HPB49_002503 [Dermacentor silvarum]|uniref:Uncharacterized protein n=1 Tax=Dermacentor silvarum TaxID=543639 RepID=A0ACB8CP77_DERSI|nr:cytosolic endo-beta-N-acetylglucosaminidase [Dermacentor silvarum]KAH7948809.1 hypothetical protein HPB49_002503 [Dermacentor silvarum]